MSAEPRNARSYARSGFAVEPRSAVTIPGCTERQRRDIRGLLRYHGLPTCYLTDQHSELFQRAGVPCEYGRALDTTLRAVSGAAAQRLITTLRETV